MKKTTALLSGLFYGWLAIGQVTFASNQLNLFAGGAIPVGNFSEVVAPDGGAFGIGGGASMLFNPKGKKAYFPVWFGIDFNYLTFGRDKQPSLPDMPALKTAFNYYGTSGIARIFLSGKSSGFVPFMDVQGGLNIINTRTKIDKNLLDLALGEEYPEVLHTTNDAGLMYGVSLGWFTRKIPDEHNDSPVSFFMKAGYIAGSDIKHVKRGTMKINNGEVTYESTTTSVNNFIFQFGIQVPL